MKSLVGAACTAEVCGLGVTARQTACEGLQGLPDPGVGSAVEATRALAVPPVVKKALPVAAAGPLAIAPVAEAPVGVVLLPVAVPASAYAGCPYCWLKLPWLALSWFCWFWPLNWSPLAELLPPPVVAAEPVPLAPPELELEPEPEPEPEAEPEPEPDPEPLALPAVVPAFPPLLEENWPLISEKPPARCQRSIMLCVQQFCLWLLYGSLTTENRCQKQCAGMVWRAC